MRKMHWEVRMIIILGQNFDCYKVNYFADRESSENYVVCAWKFKR